MAASVNNHVLPETTSTCLSQKITGAHNFVITNFSQLDGMGIGKYVSSGNFTIGGCSWKLNFYPDGEGETKDKVAYTSVFYRFLEGPVGTRITSSISLFTKEDDQPVSKHKKGKKKRNGKGNKVFEAKCDMRTPEPDTRWGWHRFIKKSRMRELAAASNDCFTIRFVVTVFKVRTDDVATIEVPPPSLHLDFARMLEDEEGADVTIKVGDEFFLAHKYVLATRSKVFRAQLFGVMKESFAECIEIDGMEPSVFERLLYFIYTDSLSEKYQGNKIVAIQHLLVAADRYGLNRLRLICEEKLCSWIDVQSVATTLVLAEQHQCGQLKDACLDFMAWRDVLGPVMKTEGFKHLTESGLPPLRRLGPLPHKLELPCRLELHPAVLPQAYPELGPPPLLPAALCCPAIGPSRARAATTAAACRAG
ncbi:hypothetical protein PR202_gb14314 [Eleusine coracana subsp. coracana]|uniref:Uncharacterized protein n=1 Tax=Eleusine coracana subsp. coracana TaxID=191504 RepID=A0AAV5EU88_ELECO|nr:hypothetical protein PR202_gb14314 [Eleusine coracana subsp. coracana]